MPDCHAELSDEELANIASAYSIEFANNKADISLHQCSANSNIPNYGTVMHRKRCNGNSHETS